MFETRLGKAGETGVQGALSLCQRTLDHLPDGILLVSAERRVIYANEAFRRIWQIPPELVETRDDAKLLACVTNRLEDPQRFYAEVERLYGSRESSEDIVRFSDGRIIARRSVPFQLEGEDWARIWIFTDVTEAWLAQTDPLTGLPNRRAYGRLFSKFATAADDGLFKAVGLMDIDNFKKYNDLYGHAAGDEALRRIGALLSARLSGDDTAFRIGGEEFLIACRSRSEDGAVSFCETLRADLEQAAIGHQGNPPGNVVTASFGLAVFRGGCAPGRLFDAVDTALYRSKSAGRNRVTLADIAAPCPAAPPSIAAVAPAPAARPRKRLRHAHA